MTVLSEARAVVSGLSDEDRAALAHELITSLDRGHEIAAVEAEAAWDAEIADRLDRFGRNDATLIDEGDARDLLGS